MSIPACEVPESSERNAPVYSSVSQFAPESLERIGDSFALQEHYGAARYGQRLGTDILQVSDAPLSMLKLMIVLFAAFFLFGVLKMAR